MSIVSSLKRLLKPKVNFGHLQLVQRGFVDNFGDIYGLTALWYISLVFLYFSPLSLCACRKHSDFENHAPAVENIPLGRFCLCYHETILSSFWGVMNIMRRKLISLWHTDTKVAVATAPVTAPAPVIAPVTTTAPPTSPKVTAITKIKVWERAQVLFLSLSLYIYGIFLGSILCW